MFVFVLRPVASQLWGEVTGDLAFPDTRQVLHWLPVAPPGEAAYLGHAYYYLYFILSRRKETNEEKCKKIITLTLPERTQNDMFVLTAPFQSQQSYFHSFS